MKTYYVYFMKPVGQDGPIKIGCSFVPQSRLESFTVWSPIPIEMIGKVPGTFDDEKFLHQCFAAQHSHREWFHASEKLLTIINEIIAAGSIAPARAAMRPTGSIRTSRGVPRTPDQRRLHSFTLRLAWIHRQRHMRGVPVSDPQEISRIMTKWRGWSYRHVPGVTPSADDIAKLESYVVKAREEVLDLPLKARPALPRHVIQGVAA